MRELHTSIAVSLDGLRLADGSHSFARTHGYHDEEFGRYAAEMMGGHDTVICGRKTFMTIKESLVVAAATQPGAYENTMSAHTQIVFSNTLTDEEVGKAVRYRGDLVENVKALKEQPGRDIMLLGSGSVRTQLLNAGLIDRIKIWWVPIALGSGEGVFAGVTGPINFKMMRSYTFSSGLVRAEYQVVKPDADS
jgi:dihydrofolate reductase